jgi:phosphoribosyl 1,2-cyclic phosphodiesterase
MPLQFTVLASGSAGNASLLDADGFGLLLDVGLGPRQLASRLAAVGASWQGVHAVLLTHTHTDHWRETTLAHLRRRRIPLYCHADHLPGLTAYGSAFAGLLADNLVRFYRAGEDLSLAPGLCCRPVPLRHDCGATFGFRFEGRRDLFGEGSRLGYAADLGSWTVELAEALADVDLLALEFNHDVGLERSSGRSPYLIARVLGEDGHLSNEQAANLLREVLRRSTAGRLRQLVQLHLSRDCNRPHLAAEVARTALAACTHPVAVHTASQDEPGPILVVGAPEQARRPARLRSPRIRLPGASAGARPWLPGLEV